MKMTNNLLSTPHFGAAVYVRCQTCETICRELLDLPRPSCIPETTHFCLLG